MSEARWFVRSGLKETGPFTFAELQERITRRELRSYDELREEEDVTWHSADTVDGLFETDAEAGLEEMNLDEIELMEEPVRVESVATGTAETGTTGTDSETAGFDDFDVRFESQTPVPASSGPAKETISGLPLPDAEASPKAGWYYRTLGQEMGPIEYGDLIDLARDGSLAPDDEVRNGLEGRWMRAERIGQLRNAFPKAVASSPPAEAPAKAKIAPRKSSRPVRKSNAGRPANGTPKAKPDRSSVPTAREAVPVAKPAAPEKKPTPAPAPKAEAPKPEPSKAPTPPAPASTPKPTPSFTPPTPSKAAAAGAPVKKAVPKRKSSGGGGGPKIDFGEMLEPLKEQMGKVIALAVLAVIAGGWYLSPLLFAAGADTEYNQLNAIYEEFKSLRDSGADSGKWSQFADKHRPALKKIEEDMLKVANSQRRDLQAVLRASRSLGRMLTTARDEPEQNEQDFIRYMDQYQAMN